MRLRCTLVELGQRMSAEELGLWIAYDDTQPFGDPHLEQAVALLQAALHNGPTPRKDKRHWVPRDFLVRDPWAPPPEAPRRRGKRDRGPSLDQIRAHMGRKKA